MLNIRRDTHSLTDFKQNTPEFVDQLKDTGEPIFLTINGKAELVVHDTASYQRLIELAEKGERMEILRASVEEMKAGKGIRAEDVLAEMKQIVAEKQDR